MSKQSIEVRKRKLMRSAATRATAKYTCGGLPRKVQPPKPVSLAPVGKKKDEE